MIDKEWLVVLVTCSLWGLGAASPGLLGWACSLSYVSAMVMGK